MESSPLMYIQPAPVQTGRAPRHAGPLHRLLIFATLSLLIAVPVACGRGEAQSPAPAQQAIRAPKPTFTPAPNVGSAAVAAEPAQAAAPDQAAAGVGGAVATTDSLTPTGAKAVINTPLVNVRAGPGLDFEVVTIVERGQEFDILAKDALGEWWQLCCVDDEPVWAIGQLVDTDGPVDAVPVYGQQKAQTAASVQPAVAAAADDEMLFDLKNTEQFAEASMVRIFLYVYAGTESLAGYTLRVVYNGTELPVNTVSFGGQAGFTWPFQDARQRSQNWKAEFSGIGPAGVWELQLLDSSGRRVGPPATFTLGADDPNRELYVRYERR